MTLALPPQLQLILLAQAAHTVAPPHQPILPALEVHTAATLVLRQPQLRLPVPSLHPHPLEDPTALHHLVEATAAHQNLLQLSPPQLSPRHRPVEAMVAHQGPLHLSPRPRLAGATAAPPLAAAHQVLRLEDTEAAQAQVDQATAVTAAPARAPVAQVDQATVVALLQVVAHHLLVGRTAAHPQAPRPALDPALQPALKVPTAAALPQLTRALRAATVEALLQLTPAQALRDRPTRRFTENGVVWR